ncbi:MAG: transposase [Thiohalocapsa sp.]
MKWYCKYHVVFVPKYRRRSIGGALRREIGGILREL